MAGILLEALRAGGGRALSTRATSATSSSRTRCASTRSVNPRLLPRHARGGGGRGRRRRGRGAASGAKPLAGRVAIVTGACRGIGKGCALELGAAGATVYLTGRTVEEGAAPLPGTVGATAAEVDAAGGRGIAGALRPPRRRAGRGALRARGRRAARRLDVLVNNAFLIPKRAHLRQALLGDADLELGRHGRRRARARRTSRAGFAAPLMVARKRGLIANVELVGRGASTRGTSPTASASARSTASPPTPRTSSRPFGVAVVSLWPGLVLTERIVGARSARSPTLDFDGAESQRFTGRAVVALAADPDALRAAGAHSRRASSRTPTASATSTAACRRARSTTARRAPAAPAGSEPAGRHGKVI